MDLLGGTRAPMTEVRVEPRVLAQEPAIDPVVGLVEDPAAAHAVGPSRSSGTGLVEAPPGGMMTRKARPSGVRIDPVAEAAGRLKSAEGPG